MRKRIWGFALLAICLTAGLVQAQAGPERLTLVPRDGQTCITEPNGTITIDVYLDQLDPAHPITGVQYNVTWDPTSCWQLIEPPGDAVIPGPGLIEGAESIGTGFVIHSVNVPTGAAGMSAPQVIASLTFKATNPPNGCCVVQLCLTAGSGATGTRVVGVPPYVHVPILGACVAIRIDLMDPTITCGPDMVVDTSPGDCFWKPSTAQPIVKPTYSDNCTDCQLAPPTFVRSDGRTGLNAKYALGVTTITWTVTDCCGRQASCVQKITVRDKEPPKIEPDCATREVCADENCQFILPDWKDWTDPVLVITDNCDTDPDVVMDPPAGTAFGLGEHDVMIGVNDSHGNNTSCTIKFIVKDCTKPEFTILPENMELCADAGKCTAKVTWNVAAKDNCAGPVTLQSVPPSGSLFPIGTTVVVVSATDAAGNMTEESFTVTVNPCWVMNLEVGLGYPCNTKEHKRCIQVELSDCNGVLPMAEVGGEFTFINGLASGQLTIPTPSRCVAGAYNCARAKDPRASLWSMTDGANVSIVGTAYLVKFLGPDALLLGNIDGNEYIDIVDWAIWMLQFSGQMPIPLLPSPLCDPWPDMTDPSQWIADVTGDGRVTAADYANVYRNYWLSDEGPCCPPAPTPVAMVSDGVSKLGPISRLSIVQLKAMGLAGADSLDVNRDGYIDAADAGIKLKAK